MAEFFDIVMVGGGPAGSTAGTLLAKQGWDVAIFEKGKFPRFKIGESLLPDNYLPPLPSLVIATSLSLAGLPSTYRPPPRESQRFLRFKLCQKSSQFL